MTSEPVAEKKGFVESTRAVFEHGWSHHYIQVFLYLLALTIVTVGASYLPISTAGHIFVALVIAGIKAGLVAATFMHLLWERILIHRLMAFTLFFALALVFLSILGLTNPVAGTQ